MPLHFVPDLAAMASDLFFVAAALGSKPNAILALLVITRFLHRATFLLDSVGHYVAGFRGIASQAHERPELHWASSVCLSKTVFQMLN